MRDSSLLDYLNDKFCYQLIHQNPSRSKFSIHPGLPDTCCPCRLPLPRLAFSCAFGHGAARPRVRLPARPHVGPRRAQVGPMPSGRASVAGRIGPHFELAAVSFQSFSSSSMPRNYSSAVSRLSTISRARIAGSGRLSESSRHSSLSQKMSRLALSRFTRSS